MRDLNKFLLGVNLLCLFTVISSFAQQKQNNSKSELKLLKEISDALDGFNVHAVLTDSIPYLTLNVRLDIEKKNNKTTLKSIKSNDTLAFKMFNKMENLRKIDYSKLLNNNERITLVIPYIYYNKTLNHIPISPEILSSDIYNAFNPFKIYTSNYKSNKVFQRIIILLPIIYEYNNTQP